MKMYSLSKIFPKYAHSVDSKTNASVHFGLRYRKKKKKLDCRSVMKSWNPHGSWALILCVMSFMSNVMLAGKIQKQCEIGVLHDGAHRYAVQLSLPHTHTYTLRDWYLGGTQGWTAMCFQELFVWVVSLYIHTGKQQVACVTCGRGLYSIFVFFQL